MFTQPFSAQSFTGSPSFFSSSRVVESLQQNCCVVFSISGSGSTEAVERWTEKIKQTEFTTLSEMVHFFQRQLDVTTEAEVEVVAIWFGENTVGLFAHLGEIWLQRDGKVGKVLQAQSKIAVLEGKLLKGDQYLLLTRSATVESSTLTTKSGTLHQQYSLLQSSLPRTPLSDRIAIAHLQATPTAPNQQLQNRNSEPTLIERTERKQLLGLNKRRLRLFKTPLMLSAIIIFLLLIVFFGLRFQSNRQTTLGATFILPYQQEMQGIIASTSDPLEVKDKLEALKRKIEADSQNVSKHTNFQRAVNSLLSQVDEQLTLRSGTTQMTSLPVYFDLQEVRAGFVATQVAAEGEWLVMLDTGTQTFVSFNTNSKEYQFIPVGQYSSVRDILLHEMNLYILADGVYQFALSQQQTAKKIIEEGDSNKDGVLLGAFGRYMYIFNPEKRNIFRYLTDDVSAVSQPIGWITDKKDIDFTSISSMEVDGGIWLTTNAGDIIKFLQGEQQEFNIQGMSQPFSSALTIETHTESNNVYILEPNQQRVVVLSKEGQFIKEVVSPSLAAAVHLVIREDLNTVFAVAGSLIYEIQL